jgi:hypothetical protein
MRMFGVFWRCATVAATLLVNTSAWADAFVEFFTKQKVGQEITVTGGFHKFAYKRQFYERNHKTGDVKYYEYFGMSMVPTQIFGDGSLALKASLHDTLLFVYTDDTLVKDLPEEGQDLWFTGTLIGYQYGINGITSGALSGGDPYILLKRVSTQPPQEAIPIPPRIAPPVQESMSPPQARSGR